MPQLFPDDISGMKAYGRQDNSTAVSPHVKMGDIAHLADHGFGQGYLVFAGYFRQHNSSLARIPFFKIVSKSAKKSNRSPPANHPAH
jgi:hypothetical protein